MRLKNVVEEVMDPNDPSKELHYSAGKSNSGWITQQILYEYLCNTVDKWLTKNKIKRPVILFSDYHETRNILRMLVKKNKTLLYSIHSNKWWEKASTTHHIAYPRMRLKKCCRGSHGSK